MENKLEKIIIDPIVPFFVHDKWHEKIELYQLTYNHKTFSYHYLKDFFHLSVHDAEDALIKLQKHLENKYYLDELKTEHFLLDLPNSIAFFARGVFSHQSSHNTPFLLTNQELVHYKNLKISSFLSKRLKIKMDEAGISELFDHEENFQPLIEDQIELVLDFNQTLKAIDVHHLKKIIDHHPLKNHILYLEDPLKAHDYHHLNKDELKNKMIYKTNTFYLNLRKNIHLINEYFNINIIKSEETKYRYINNRMNQIKKSYYYDWNKLILFIKDCIDPEFNNNLDKLSFVIKGTKFEKLDIVYKLVHKTQFYNKYLNSKQIKFNKFFKSLKKEC